MVALLTLAYLLSYIDRSVLGLLVQPIKADLGLSDAQIGWLLGPAFAIFYATVGLPLGWLVDHKPRTRLIALGVTVWSAATAACGMATGFLQLFLARMTVGVGEAVLSPAAFSIIGDSFPVERRARPIAIYSMAITLGAGIASLIGAAVLTWAKSSPEITLPVLGTIAPWQATFLAVGLPGFAVAIVFLLVREPRRQPVVGVADNSFREVLRYVVDHRREYLLIIGIVAAMVIVAYSQGFLAAAFERRWGWPPEYYARLNGIVSLVVGPAVYLATGTLCDRLLRAGDSDAPLKIMSVSLIVLVPSGSVAMLMPSAWLAFAVLTVATGAIGAISAVGVTALLQRTPPAIRGQVVALYYMAISLAGLLLGPTTVGFLSTHVLGEERLHLAIGAIPLIYGTLPALFALWVLARPRAPVKSL